MKLTLSRFSGEIPRVIPRLLPDNSAQTALNTKLNNGSIEPVHESKLVKTLDSPAQSIYFHNNEWFSWPVPVNVAPGPIAQDRLYVTGDGKPKMLVDGNTFNLAVPAPSTKPNSRIDESSEIDPDLSSTIQYAYTWVTEYFEESEPSPLSDPLLWSPGIDVTLSLFESAPSGRAISKMRIYRSQTSALGATELFLIAERDVSTDNFIDSDLPFSEPIPSIEYNQPPDDLSGIISLPNGMMSAFRGKEIYFCEPYIPHAWPQSYILTTDFEIVGLGAFGSSMVIMTKGDPYIVQGTAPANMTMEKLELNLPCISARGIVDLGYSIAYPTHDGLVTFSTNGAQLVTRSLFTREQWQDLKPETFISGQHSGRYLASYSVNGEKKMLVIDLTGEQPFIVRSTEYAEAVFYEVEDGNLYLLHDGMDIVQYDAYDQPYLIQEWKSKPFVLPTYTNFGAMLIYANSGDVTVNLYADDGLIATVTKTDQIARLPARIMGRKFEIEVISNVQVDEITLANTPSDITGG